MKHLVIAGTSGVGKTYLEEYLESQKLTWQLPKYFDRPNRPDERRDKNISLNKTEWMSARQEFFFTLHYSGYHYGWKRSDMKNGKISTLAITLESLEEFLRTNTNFIPLLLWIDWEHLALLEQRMKIRGDTDETIKKRLILAKEEIKAYSTYKDVTEKFKGLVIYIKDNTTIYKELIPQIPSLSARDDIE